MCIFSLNFGSNETWGGLIYLTDVYAFIYAYKKFVVGLLKAGKY